MKPPGSAAVDHDQILAMAYLGTKHPLGTWPEKTLMILVDSMSNDIAQDLVLMVSFIEKTGHFSTTSHLSYVVSNHSK